MIIKSKKILNGALSLGLGAFIAKLLGAVYRVPLTNLLGAAGLGLYQMVFPVYTVLLDFSGAGVPSALSKIISSQPEQDKIKSANAYLFTSLKLLFFVGLVFSTLTLIFARSISLAQGNGRAFLGYVFLSPAVLLVSMISCFRGYFQGLMDMRPTAISQVIEQVVKLGLGLLFVYLFLPNIEWAVGGATLAITLSELGALSYLYLTYLKSKRKYSLKFALDKANFKTMAKSVVKLTFPITVVGILIPLSQVVDSFLAINILSTYRQDATSLYGILSGVVATVIGLPVSICYGVATVAIPAVAKNKDRLEQNRNGLKTILFTILVALPSATICYFFAPFIINLLFGSLGWQEKSVAIKLLRLSSPCVLLLSLLQTCNAVLIGKGKPYFPVISLGLGVIIKEILNVILFKIPSLNIYGGAIALIACYFTVCLVNLIMIFGYRRSKKVNDADKRALRREYAS